MLAKLESRAKTTPVPMDQGDVPNYEDLWAIGFGDINPAEKPRDQEFSTKEDFTYPERLQDVKVSFIENNQCEAIYSRYSLDITGNMLCAASPGKDSCQADSVRMCSSERKSWHHAIIEIRTIC
jgi:secreted trypsin-like serine protease